MRRRRGWRRRRRYTYFNWTCWENMMCMCSTQKQAHRRFAMRTLHQKWNQNIIWSTFAIIAVCRLPKDHVKHSLFFRSAQPPQQQQQSIRFIYCLETNQCNESTKYIKYKRNRNINNSIVVVVAFLRSIFLFSSFSESKPNWKCKK